MCCNRYRHPRKGGGCRTGVEGDTPGFSELLGLEGTSCGGVELRREQGELLEPP